MWLIKVTEPRFDPWLLSTSPEYSVARGLQICTLWSQNREHALLGEPNWPVKGLNHISLTTPDFLGECALDSTLGCGQVSTPSVFGFFGNNI